ncbi:Y-family DNA polymerase [Paraburkholderia sp. HD33-4]|uniref:Y-family DNA polymerase n=1 Tax=Paraburkholderia sp. HD33-4 TaxID=2883242 RepID=UPI001F26EC17|nr:hypothetical protein [Paraburkholderia sp. HD33-4]
MPFAVAEGLAVPEKERVIAAEPRVRDARVCLGMRRGGIRTLAPSAVMQERDSTAEANAVRKIASGLPTLSPQELIAEESTVLVDVSASLRLFRGTRSRRRMARRVAEAIGVTATIGIAPNGQAAWLPVRYRGSVMLSHDSLSRLLASLIFRESIPLN